MAPRESSLDALWETSRWWVWIWGLSSYHDRGGGEAYDGESVLLAELDVAMAV
jgi:hypothetical protein